MRRSPSTQPTARHSTSCQLDLRGIIGYTDYFVICSGRSDRQTKAIHDAIHAGMKSEHGLLPRRVEGVTEARWILMDYLDVVVHVFTPETREYYRLEQLWGEAPAHAPVQRAPTRRSAPRRRGAHIAVQQLGRDLLLAAHHARQLDHAVLSLGAERARDRARCPRPRAGRCPCSSTSVTISA